MRRMVLLIGALVALLPMLAQADIPPPPDEYNGPPTAHIAGLTFTHQRIRTYVQVGTPPEIHPAGYSTYVILTDCDSGHPNCVAAKKLGLLGGAVVAVDDQQVAADVSVVVAAFNAAHKQSVRLSMLTASEAASPPDKPKTITLVVRPK